MKRSYLIDNAELMKDWHQELNPGIDPSKLTKGSHVFIKWKCHKCGRTWDAMVKNRMNGDGCTCDAMARKTVSLRKTLVKKHGSLANNRPDIAAQWHPTKNGTLSPDEFTVNSEELVWWIDSNGHEWEARIVVRCQSEVAGSIPRNRVIAGENDLKTRYPAIAAQWHPTKNGDSLPEQFLPGSDAKIWWLCEKGHEYPCKISARTRGRCCTICSRELSTSFPEQAIYYYTKQKYPSAENRFIVEPYLEIDVYLPDYKVGIEYDGAYYHKVKSKQERDAKKNKRLKELGIRLIRIMEEGCPIPDGSGFVIIAKRHKNKLQLDAAITEALQLINSKCGTNYEFDVDTVRDRVSIQEQYIRLEKENGITVIAPELLAEWHPQKNGTLRPEYVRAGSSGNVWWLCSKCEYEWAASPFNRVHGQGCPVCSGNIVVPGKNDLCTTHEVLAKEWHPTKNGEKLPHQYSAGSGEQPWWVCSECGYEWQALISNRSRGQGCPRCAGKVTVAEDSLAVKMPELAAQWHPVLNGDLKPTDVLPGSSIPVYWICENGHHWKNTVYVRALQKHGCPFCTNKLVWPGFNDLAFKYPELVTEWDDSNDFPPNQVLAGSTKDYVWRCSNGHTWKASVYERVHRKGCPYCTGARVIAGFNDLATTHPELANEWDYDENELTPQQVMAGSSKKVSWKCSKCGEKWKAIICSRRDGRGCPYCAGKRPRPGQTDFATLHKELAEEWDYEENGDLRPEQFLPGSGKEVGWKCKVCGHKWKARIASRSRGFNKCPKCN